MELVWAVPALVLALIVPMVIGMIDDSRKERIAQKADEETQAEPLVQLVLAMLAHRDGWELDRYEAKRVMADQRVKMWIANGVDQLDLMVNGVAIDLTERQQQRLWDAYSVIREVEDTVLTAERLAHQKAVTMEFAKKIIDAHSGILVDQNKPQV